MCNQGEKIEWAEWDSSKNSTIAVELENLVKGVVWLSAYHKAQWSRNYLTLNLGKILKSDTLEIRFNTFRISSVNYFFFFFFSIGQHIYWSHYCIISDHIGNGKCLLGAMFIKDIKWKDDEILLSLIWIVLIVWKLYLVLLPTMYLYYN